MLAVRVLCKQWRCSYCAEKKRRQLVGLAMRGHPNTFITLTTNPAVSASPLEAAQMLIAAWRRVYRKIRAQKKNKDFEFLAVMEATKRGEPHLHVIARSRWIDQAWLSQQMANEIAAPVVDIRRINDAKRASGYCAKYVGKAPHQFGTLKRTWHSRRWELKKTPKPEWPHIVGRTLEVPASEIANHIMLAIANGLVQREATSDFMYWGPPDP